MNDKAKYRDRWLAGALISRLLNKTGTSAKLAAVAGGIGIPAVIAAGLYFDIDLDLDSEPMPEPTPIIIDGLSHDAAIQRVGELEYAIKEKEKPEWLPSWPTPSNNANAASASPEPSVVSTAPDVQAATPRPRESTSPPSPSENETSTAVVIQPESSPAPTSTSTPEPSPQPTPTATTTTSPVTTSTPARSDADGKAVLKAAMEKLHGIPSPSPSPTPEPTDTPIPVPTATTIEPTATAVPPTPTPEPTATPIPPTPLPAPTGLEITWAVRFPWGVPDGAPDWVWDSMNGTIYGESTSALLDYPRLRMTVRVGDCDAKLQVVGDLDGQTFPLGSGEMVFRLLGRGQSADIAAGPFAAYYVSRAPNISVSEASVSVTVYDEIAASLELPLYAATYGTNGTNPRRQRESEACSE